MTRSYVVAPIAKADILGILVWSQDKFGDFVRNGYEELISVAINDIVENPAHTGARERPELGKGVLAWHLALSKNHVRVDVRRIAKPRHIVFYREVDDEVHILRVLHDAMDFQSHRIG